MQPDPVIFTPLLAAACTIFLWSCYRRFSLVTVGAAEDRFSNAMDRLQAMFVYAFLQKRVVKRPFGVNHVFIFWSFLILAVANTEFLVSGVFPAAKLSLVLPAALYQPLLAAFDLVSLFALAAVVIALVRRAVAPPYKGARTGEAFAILSMIGALMLAYFGLHAAEIGLGHEPAAHAMPLSSALAAALSGLSPENLETFGTVSWWLHAGVLLFFLNYLPYSKHMHILAAIPNCYFKGLSAPNTQQREEFAEGNVYGAGSIENFTWKDLFDSFSCTECGRCEKACPAAATGKPLNPRLVMHDIKVNLLANGTQLQRGGVATVPVIGEGEGSVEADALWSCTTCGACLNACPVFIEQMPKINKMRRHLVQMEADFPEELLNLFENMEQRSNPWGIAPGDRGKWVGGQEVKPFEAGKTEYLFYVGCAGSFDSRAKQVTLSVARILDAAGVSWGILGKEEKCCGDSVRRLGNEYVFDKMARENVAMFQEKKVTKVITQCPHCYSTLKNDYRQYGLELEVIPHAELIEQLLGEGKLQLDMHEAKGGNIVFHDSCYLGRHNGIYDAPRKVIAQATGTLPAEMPRNRENSFCCGAGGGRMWLEEHLGERINLNRVNEALAGSPGTICVTCPYCMTMMEDGLKDRASGETKVKDIAEIVAEGLKGRA
uniref:4Fe-4S ferredoxin-type domain-containing protein n=1 Tax=Geobacter sp. (strain M21) TaxID=443144 RepID=C6E270_GEOSM